MAATTRKDWGQPQGGGQGFARTMKAIGRTVNLAVADLTLTAFIGAFMVPAGFVVTGIIAVASKMDTGTVALTINVGDAANAFRYLAGSTIGQAGTTTQTLASAGLLFKNTVDTEIQVSVGVVPNVAAAGNIQLYLTGFIDN